MGNAQLKLSQNSDNPQQDEEQTDSENPSTFTCEICIEPILTPNQKFKNGNKCVHPFCLDCTIKYITVSVEDNISSIKCPALKCEQLLDPLYCKPLIPPKLFDKWCDVLCESALLGLDRCFCPNRNCSALVVNECGGVVRRSVCPNCKRLFCFHCRIPWHAGYRCEESREMRDANDVAFGVLVERRKWTRCPRCHHFVELIEGCAIVKCRCRTSFCYKCGRKVNQHWCECHSPPTCFIWSLRVFLLIMIFWPLLFLYMDATKKASSG